MVGVSWGCEMTKTTFVNGTVLTPEYLNALQNIQFDGQDLDGHYPQLNDDALTDTAGNIKPEWRAFRDALKVSPQTGTIFAYGGGVTLLPNGNTATIAPATISVGANGTFYIFVDKAGAIVQATQLPLLSVPLAKVVMVGGNLSGAIEDMRPRFRVLPLAQAMRLFGGQGGQGEYNLASGSATLSGEYYFTNFTVAQGATLNINGFCKIQCTGNVNIAGQVIVSPPVAGGSAHRGIFRAGSIVSAQGNGLGGGRGVNDSGALPYSYIDSPIGSGGAGGWLEILVPQQGIIGCKGGNGGGNFRIEAYGSIVVSGSILANGEDGQNGSTALDFSTNLPISPTSNAILTGGGGGSGGLIYLASLTSVTAGSPAQLSVRGGQGGTAYPLQANGLSAGGGGGGYIVCIAPTVNLTGATINLSGGASPPSPGTYGSVPGGSFAGQGGATSVAGGSGQLIVRNVIPG